MRSRLAIATQKRFANYLKGCRCPADGVGRNKDENSSMKAALARYRSIRDKGWSTDTADGKTLFLPLVGYQTYTAFKEGDCVYFGGG